MLKKVLAIACASLALVGCKTIETVVVTKTVYVATTISPELTKKIESPGIPFTPEEYLKFTDRQRRSGLLDMIADRDAALETCNIRLYAVEKEVDATVKRIAERNKENVK